MPRQPARNDRRSRIAHLAARLMAEDGIEDYALAKRKAARQAGLSDSRDLPSNEEVESALRTHRALYEEQAHEDRLRTLRATALRAMRDLSRFQPYLTGSVLSGTAGRYADINLQLFTDSAKSVELFLIDRQVPYRTAQARLYCGAETVTAPVFRYADGDTDIEITVLSPRELRAPLRATPEGRAIERAKARAVEELLAGE